MKLTPPGSLRLDRERLLQDVQDRLAERMPGLDGSNPDPTDPGWLLMEQATWLAEQLSAELDRYPLAVLQQFLHLVGAGLEPAVPSVGVMVVDPREAGEIRVTRDRPADWRFFTPQTEDRDPIEFVPAEPRAPVSPLAVRGTWQWDGSQLFNVTGHRAAGGEGAAGSVVPTGKPVRSAAFDQERIDYRLVATDTETLLERVQGVIEKIRATDSSWLQLEARPRGDSEVVVQARISPFAALRKAAGGQVAPGGDLLVPWAPVEGSTWTPPVRFLRSPRLPLRLRGAEPMPGPEDGTLLVRNLPASLSLEDLLVPAAAPLPRPVVDAIWRALRRLDSRISGLRPQVERHLEVGAADAPPSPWIPAVLQSNAWARLTGTTPRAFVYLEVPEPVERARSVRVALQWEQPQPVADLQAWAIVEGSLADDPIPMREAWSLPVPSPTDSQGLDHVQALDIDLAEGQRGVLLSLPRAPRAVLPNALVVINAPLVPDGRELVVERAVPEAASLLEEDVVGKVVMERLLQQPLGASTRAMLEQLPLAHFTVSAGDPIDDFRGIGLDSSAGRITFNAPDVEGEVRNLRPETNVSLEWYRRTDGSLGEVEAGAIQYVEQSPSTRPHLRDCINPSGTWFGSARETELDARERMFSPTSDLPVVPGDWERLIRRELGARGRGWIVRCWGHAERSLISTACWPLDDPGEESETRRFLAGLERAGPDTLVVVLGPKDRVLSLAELDAARRVVASLIKRVRRRLPTIQRAEVTRLWPLVMEVEDDAKPPLPCFAAPDLTGTLVDPAGTRSAPPDVALLLNAAVVQTTEVVL